MQAPSENIVENEVVTFNLIFLGTNEHRGKSHTILTQFANQLDNVVVFDGPGASSSTDSSHPTPGTYLFNPQTDEKEIILPQGKFLSFRKKTHEIQGIINGIGVEDNILEATVKIIGFIKANRGKQICLNLAGFSRGADTTLRLANVISQLFSQDNYIEGINIFSLDPVPDARRMDHAGATYIPKMVKSYYSILMEDENRLPEFEGRDRDHIEVEDASSTVVGFDLLKGTHAFAQKLGNDPALRDPSYFTAYKLAEFYQAHGATFKDNSLPPVAIDKKKVKETNLENNDYAQKYQTPLQRLAAFQRIRENKTAFEKLRQFPIGERNFLKHKEKYVRDAYYFQTQQEREDFKAVYPEIFDWYFQGGYDFYKKMGFSPKLVDEAMFAQAKNIHFQLQALRESANETDKKIYQNIQNIVNPALKQQGVTLLKAEDDVILPKHPAGLCLEERRCQTHRLPLLGNNALENLFYRIEENYFQYPAQLQNLYSSAKIILNKPQAEEKKIELIQNALLKLNEDFEKNNRNNACAIKLACLLYSTLPSFEISSVLNQSCKTQIISSLEKLQPSLSYKNEVDNRRTQLIQKAIDNIKYTANLLDIHEILKKVIAEVYILPTTKGKRRIASTCSKLISEYGLDIVAQSNLAVEKIYKTTISEIWTNTLTNSGKNLINKKTQEYQFKKEGPTSLDMFDMSRLKRAGAQTKFLVMYGILSHSDENKKSVLTYFKETKENRFNTPHNNLLFAAFQAQIILDKNTEVSNDDSISQKVVTDALNEPGFLDTLFVTDVYHKNKIAKDILRNTSLDLISELITTNPKLNPNTDKAKNNTQKILEIALDSNKSEKELKACASLPKAFRDKISKINNKKSGFFGWMFGTARHKIYQNTAALVNIFPKNSDTSITNKTQNTVPKPVYGAHQYDNSEYNSDEDEAEFIKSIETAKKVISVLPTTPVYAEATVEEKHNSISSTQTSESEKRLTFSV